MTFMNKTNSYLIAFVTPIKTDYDYAYLFNMGTTSYHT